MELSVSESGTEGFTLTETAPKNEKDYRKTYTQAEGRSKQSSVMADSPSKFQNPKSPNRVLKQMRSDLLIHDLTTKSKNHVGSPDKETVLQEVLKQQSPKPIKKLQEVREKLPKQSKPVDFDWIYRDRPAKAEEIDSLFRMDDNVNIGLLADGMSKLKMDITKRIGTRQDNSDLAVARHKLEEFQKQVQTMILCSEQDRETILQNTKKMDQSKAIKKPKQKNSNRLNKSAGEAEFARLAQEDSVAGNPEVKLNARGKSPAQKEKIAKVKEEYASLNKKRVELLQHLESTNELNFKGQDYVLLLETLARMAEDPVVDMFNKKLSSLESQSKAKQVDIDCLEHNMMRERHFILDKLGEKRALLIELEEQFDSILDDHRKRLEESKRKAEEAKVAAEKEKYEANEYHYSGYQFEAQSIPVKVFEEDMSQFLEKATPEVSSKVAGLNRVPNIGTQVETSLPSTIPRSPTGSSGKQSLLKQTTSKPGKTKTTKIQHSKPPASLAKSPVHKKLFQ